MECGRERKSETFCSCLMWCLSKKFTHHQQDQVHRSKSGLQPASTQSSRPSILPLAMKQTPSIKSSCGTPCPSDWTCSLSPAPQPSAPSPGSVFFNSEYKSDVVFMVGKPPNVWRFPAHSFILAPASPLFEAFAKGNFHLSEESEECWIIDINDVSPDVFQSLLRFIYEHEVPLNSVSSALQLLHAANRFVMYELQNQCLHFLQQNIQEQNVLEIAQNLRLFRESSDLHENDLNWRNELVMNCFRLIDNRAESILRTEAFENLQQEMVNDILSRDTLGISSELVAFDAVTKWACQECKRQRLELRPENKRAVLSKTLYNVRFFQMTTEEFMQGPAQSGLLNEDEKIAILSRIKGDSSKPLPETLNNPKLGVKRFRKPQRTDSTLKKPKKYDSSPMSEISSASSVKSPEYMHPIKEPGKKNTAWKKVKRGMRDFVIILLQILD
ncbi:BTB/POZ domain-containing protein 2-like isoform X1 [Centruroides sculpturatus]|uniref:BTB/POZ domain-containing protein 2-like isoform X1 n=2 Tax=Centruroides sculpturatus TaxID=218467 RepID=UPI000C6E6F4A|nr:BTB/POZ domain-containing protein 2-like isoform X1 [Centruroides sculpturatus]